MSCFGVSCPRAEYAVLFDFRSLLYRHLAFRLSFRLPVEMVYKTLRLFRCFCFIKYLKTCCGWIFLFIYFVSDLQKKLFPFSLRSNGPFKGFIGRLYRYEFVYRWLPFNTNSLKFYSKMRVRTRVRNLNKIFHFEFCLSSFTSSSRYPFILFLEFALILRGFHIYLGQ